MAAIIFASSAFSGPFDKQEPTDVTEMVILQFIEVHKGGNWVIYCLGGYKYIGSYALSSVSQMFETEGNISLPIKCSMEDAIYEKKRR
tara:strand:+ start:1317 stop:1580 length:264 start_codon:yes stop_codon:yes gene_type:complete